MSPSESPPESPPELPTRSDEADRTDAATRFEQDETDAEFEFKALRPRTLKDLGRVQLWALYRAGGEAPTLARRQGRRLERLFEVLDDLDDLRERGERLIVGTRSGIRETQALGELLRSVARGTEGGDLKGPERE